MTASPTASGEDARGHLGFGYVRVIAESPRAAPATIVNTGTGGDRIGDLARRWQVDVLDQNGRCGIHTDWRQRHVAAFRQRSATSSVQFEGDYRRLLDGVAAAASELVLIEPFVLPVSEEQRRGVMTSIQRLKSSGSSPRSTTRFWFPPTSN